MIKKVPIYGDGRASVYALSELYDPSKPVGSMQNIAAPTPRVNSLVIDDTVGEHNTLYVVYSVDPETRKFTLVPAKLSNDVDMYDNQIVTYGNNVYMLYWKTTTMAIYDRTTDLTARPGKFYYTRSGEEPDYTYTRVSLTSGANLSSGTYYEKSNKTLWQLVVDRKISIYGTAITHFAIYRGSSITETSNNDLVSDYYLNENGQAIQSNRMTLEQSVVQATNGSGEEYTGIVKNPVTCYSSSEIVDNDVFCLVLYDNESRVVAQIAMMAHSMLGLSELASHQWPIESFTVTANQYDPVDGKCFLIRGQRVGELSFYPRIQYANGNTVSEAAIDNTKLYIYGKDEISTAVPGSEYRVLLKYYLANTESVSTSDQRDYQIGETGRYIYTFVTVKIIAPSESSVSKIAPIPVYNSASGWTILPVVYYRNRQAPVAISSANWQSGGFDGQYYQNPQSLKIRTFETSPDSNVPVEFTSSYSITLYLPSSLTTDPKVLYTFHDDPPVSGNIYGTNSQNSPRPRLIREVDGNLGTVRHFIPQRIFTTKTVFLNAFYYAADPPTIAGESPARTPTHFQIRYPVPGSATINTVMPNPVPIDDYANVLAISADMSNSESTPGTCIVEFLYQGPGMAADQFDYLYGVPVDVVKEVVNSRVGDYRGPLYCTYNGFNYIFEHTKAGEPVNYAREWGDSTYRLVARLDGTTSFRWCLYSGSTLLTDSLSDALSVATEAWADPSEAAWGNSGITYMSRDRWPTVGECRETIYLRVKKKKFICPYTGPQDAINARRSWTVCTPENVAVGTIAVGQAPGGQFKWFITITEAGGTAAGSYSCDTGLQGSYTECPVEVSWKLEPSVTWISHDPPPVITVDPDAYVTGTQNLPITPVKVTASINSTTEALSYRKTGFPTGLTIGSSNGRITGTPTQAVTADGTVYVSSLNADEVPITVHFTITPSSAFHGIIYVIYDGALYTLTHIASSNAIDTDRVWQSGDGKMRLAAVVGDTNYGWYLHHPDENGVFHNEDPDWEDYKYVNGSSQVHPSTDLSIDPDKLDWSIGTNDHLTYLSRQAPGTITNTDPVTITGTVGVAFPVTLLNATASNQAECTYIEGTNALPGNVELLSNGQISGRIDVDGTFVSTVIVKAPGCPDAQITVTFVIEAVANCWRDPLYVITRDDMTYRQMDYGSTNWTKPYQRIWVEHSQNPQIYLKQLLTENGYRWSFTDSAAGTTARIASTQYLEENNAVEPFNAAWSMPGDLLYISKNPTSLIICDDEIEIEFYKDVPFETTTLQIQSAIGFAPPILFYCDPVIRVNGVNIDRSGVISGTISATSDQVATVRISSNVVNMADKIVSIRFVYQAGSVYQDSYWLYYAYWQGEMIYTGTASDTGYNRSWRNRNGQYPAISGNPSNNQWYPTMVDSGGDAIPCIAQPDPVPIDPDDPQASLGIDTGVGSTYIISRSPVTIGIVSKNPLNNTETGHYNSLTKTLTLSVGESVRLVATSSDPTKLQNNFIWPNIQASSTLDNRHNSIHMTAEGLIEAVGAWTSNAPLEVMVSAANPYDYMKETITVVILVPAPGPTGVTASDRTIPFTPGVPISETLTASADDPDTQFTWSGNFQNQDVSINENGQISGTPTARQTFTETAVVTATLNNQTVQVSVLVTFQYVADNTFRDPLYVMIDGVEHELLYTGGNDARGFARMWGTGEYSITGSTQSECWFINHGTNQSIAHSNAISEDLDPDHVPEWEPVDFLVTRFSQSSLISGPGQAVGNMTYHDGYPIESTSKQASTRTAVASSTNTDYLNNSFTWSAVSLPQGLSISSAGVITGTYTGTATNEPLTGRIKATSTQYPGVSKEFTVTLTKSTSWSSTITCDSLYTIYYDKGIQVTHPIVATDSGGNTLTFSSNDLPNDVTMNDYGVVGGTFNDETTRTFHVRITSSTATGQPYIDVTVQLVYRATGSDYNGNLYVAGTGFYETMTVPATHTGTVGYDRVWTGTNTRLEYDYTNSKWVLSYNGSEYAAGYNIARTADPDTGDWYSSNFAISKTSLSDCIARATTSDITGVSDATTINYTPDTAGTVLIGFTSNNLRVLSKSMTYEILTNPASGTDTFTITNQTSSPSTDPLKLQLAYNLADSATDKTLTLRIRNYSKTQVYKDFTILFHSNLVAPSSITTTSSITIDYAPSSAISHQLTATANQPATISFVPVDSVEGITVDSNGLVHGLITTKTDQTMRLNVTAANRVGSYIAASAITITFHYVSDGVFRDPLYVFLNGTEYTLSYQGNDQTTGTSRSWLNMTERLSLGYSNGDWVLTQEGSPLAAATLVNVTDDPDALTWTNGFHIYRAAQAPLLTFSNKTINYNDGYSLEQSNVSDAARQVSVTHLSGSLVPNTWSYTSSNIPTGVTLNASTGIITGRVSNSTDITFNVLATNTSNSNITKTCTVTLHMNQDGGTVISMTLPQTINFDTNDLIDVTVTAVDSAGAPLTLTSTAVPSGLTATISNGSVTIDGRITATSDSVVTITATRGWPGGQQTATTTVTFHCTDAPAPPEANYDDIVFDRPGSDVTYYLSYVPNSDPDGNTPAARRWWWASTTSQEYYEFYAEISPQNSDIVWKLEHGGWVNDQKQGGGIDATSDQCPAYYGPPDASWQSGVFNHLYWYTNH